MQITETRMTSDDTHRRAGIAIIDCHCNNILLVKQKESLKWGIPKGHLKQKESAWRGALRELSEETGIVLKRNSYIRRKRPIHIDANSLYIVQLKSEYHRFRPDCVEILEIEWRPICHLKCDSEKSPHKYNMWVRLFLRANSRI